MGCSFSASTAVRPWKPEGPSGDEDETVGKPDGRGDSAVSKGTADSGVVMESAREIPTLPGGVPAKLPPPPTCVAEGQTDRCAQGGTRARSSEILEELLNQGIIPVGERGSTAGEAFSIMLDEQEAATRRPPARLESLKANKTERFSREEFDERIRLAEERRKLKEDELKTRLRTKSARVRGAAPAPTSRAEVDGHATLTPVEPMLHPVAPDRRDPPLHSQVTREEAEGAEHTGEGEVGRAERREGAEEGGESKEHVREWAGRVSGADGEDEKEEEEELTQVEEFKGDQPLAVSEGPRNDCSLQEGRGETF